MLGSALPYPPMWFNHGTRNTAFTWHFMSRQTSRTKIIPRHTSSRHAMNRQRSPHRHTTTVLSPICICSCWEKTLGFQTTPRSFVAPFPSSTPSCMSVSFYLFGKIPCLKGDGGCSERFPVQLAQHVANEVCYIFSRGGGHKKFTPKVKCKYMKYRI